MTIEAEENQNGRGKKRNPFRRKQGEGSSEHDSEGVASANTRITQGKLRWAQHLGQRDRSTSEDGLREATRNHPWKVSSGNKLHWSPRLGQNHKSHDTRTNNDEALAVAGSREASRSHQWSGNSRNKLSLHWSPKLVRKKHNSEGSGDYASLGETGDSRLGADPESSPSYAPSYASSENGDSRNRDTDIPHHVGGSPTVHTNGGRTNSKLAWRHRSDGVSDTLSDDTPISEVSSSSIKEKSSSRITSIRQKIHRRGKSAQWKQLAGEQRTIDEEEEQSLPIGSELDALASFEHHSLASDLEVSGDTRHAAFDSMEATGSPSRRRSSTEPSVQLTSLAKSDLHRVNSLERNTPPRSIQRQHSYGSDIVNLRGGHNGSVSSALSLGATSLGAAPGLLPESSPAHSTYRKVDKKTEFRVKPYRYFDPAIFMTEAQIHEFMLQPSQKVEFLESYIAPSSKRTKTIKVTGETERIWGSTNDGRVGSLRVEVLGCVGLASVKPDVSAYLICGDVPFVTDVIPSCRSPRWPPNCKRAAVFPVHHAYARLFAGVFASKKDKANDEFCGRVVLDLASLRPNTEYDVTLPLRASSFIYDRRPRGVIRLRFSLHWFSERAAVWSYLKSPHTLAASPFGENPTILCGDPKTFRNVAITVHGQDLPGKFTRKAFQATMREFNLTRLNLIFLVRTLTAEAVLYQKPLLSLYIFVTWMHCVYTDSVKLAPAYFVGYLILCLFNNYESFNMDQERYLGFAPPTLQELLYAMFSRSQDQNLRPIIVEKNAMSSSQRNVFEKQHSGPTDGYSRDFSGDIQPLDHREFPFSERLEYPRFRPEDAIAQTKNADQSTATTSDHYLYGRLTEFASEKMSSLQSALPKVGADEDEDEWEMSDNDEEIDLNDTGDIHDDGDNVFLESEDENEEEEGPDNRGAPIESERRRIPVGPPQNSDVKPLKRVPPQVMLARAENRLHTLTFGLSMDKLFHTSLAVGKRLSSAGPGMSSSERSIHETPDVTTQSRRKKRSLLDDFDKRLGLRTRSKNPVVGITSSFLGPIMRMFRIFLIATRVVFNIGVWKDPFLSFWVLCFLVALMFILLIFPWRSFMFLSGLVLFGPQNILVRRRLLQRQAATAEKEEVPTDSDAVQSIKDGDTNTDPSEESVSLDSRASSSDGTPGSFSETPTPDTLTEDDSTQKKDSRRRRIKKKLASMREKRRLKKQASLEKDSVSHPLPPRPAFSAATYQRASKVPLEPREVVVPYTRVRTERFYDWPPDPTVSRAAPVFLADYDVAEESFVPSPSEAGSIANSLSRRRLPSEI